MAVIETRNRLLDAAFRLFSEKGTEFSLAEAAGEVGIQKPSIYAHFAGKEDLLSAAINREIDAYFSEINRSCNDLHQLFRRIIGYYERSETKLYFWKRLLLFPPDNLDDALQKKIQSHLDERFLMVTKIVESDMRRGLMRTQNPALVASCFFSLIHGMLSVKIIFKSQKDLAECETAWGVFWDGVKQ